MIRCFHFIPAHKPNLFASTQSNGADFNVFDLEDSVEERLKSCARKELGDFLINGFDERYFVRINHDSTADFAADLDFLAKNEINVLIPKITSLKNLQVILKQLPPHILKKKIMILLENVRAVHELEKILDFYIPFAIGLGLEDLFSDSVHTPEEQAGFRDHIKQKVAYLAKVFNIPAIDTVSMRFAPEELDSFENECKDSLRCGFEGKFSIHPNQIKVINKVFGITKDNLHWAEQVIGALEGREDLGYIKKDGMVISRPKILKAKKIINEYEGNHETNE